MTTMQAISKPSAEDGVSLISLSFCFSMLADTCGAEVIIPQEQRELETEAVFLVLAYVPPEGWEKEKTSQRSSNKELP